MALLSKASKNEFDTPVERLLASIANLRQQPTSKGAHFFRTSLRRFEAWSTVFDPRIDSAQKQALKFLERLNKRAGKLRDSEIHMELLEKMSDTNPQEKQRLEERLTSLRDSHRRKLRTLLNDPILRRIWRALRVLDQAPIEPGTAPVAQPIAGMSALALDEFRAFAARRGNLSPENLHEYRLACKRFRYTAELAGEQSQGRTLVQAWKEVQDVIGDWHDYLILAELAQETLNDSQLHSALVKKTDEKFAKARAVVEKIEMSLIVGRKQLPKKGPRNSGSERRSSRVA